VVVSDLGNLARRWGEEAALSHKLYTRDGSATLLTSSFPYSPECVEGEFCEVRAKHVRVA